MILTRMIDSQSVSVACDEGLLQPLAEDVLATLEKLAHTGAELSDGLRVRYGWSVLTLRTLGDGLRVHEPLFSGDPLSQSAPTLDTTLTVLTAQVDVLRRAGVHGADVVFDQHLVAAGDSLDAVDIFALRGESSAALDSGWSVAPVPEGGRYIDTTSLSAVPIYTLLDRRAGILAALALPVGYLARFHYDELLEISDSAGAVRWGNQKL